LDRNRRRLPETADRAVTQRNIELIKDLEFVSPVSIRGPETDQ
jgi:hypothetical protein